MAQANVSKSKVLYLFCGLCWSFRFCRDGVVWKFAFVFLCRVEDRWQVIQRGKLEGEGWGGGGGGGRKKERERERERGGGGGERAWNADTVKLGYYVPSREMKKKYVLTKVRSIQNAIFLNGRTGSTCSGERSATENASPSGMSLITRFSWGEIAFRASWTWKRAGKLKSKLKGWLTCSWLEKKEQKKGQKSRAETIVQVCLPINR